MRKMKNPKRWIGRKAPRDLDWEEHWTEIDVCDNCRVFHHPDDLASFLYPMCDADFDLQDALHIEEAQSFCPACLEELARDADKIDPDWSRRHGLTK